jgi:hypothetical protein
VVQCGEIEAAKKITDIDRPKGLFTDDRHACDFIRHLTETKNL